MQRSSLRLRHPPVGSVMPPGRLFCNRFVAALVAATTGVLSID
jgi:hypothetical protein